MHTECFVFDSRFTTKTRLDLFCTVLSDNTTTNKLRKIQNYMQPCY